MHRLKILVVFTLLVTLSSVVHAQSSASLTPVSQTQCRSSEPHCHNYDALVFVHGIYGDTSTFKNKETGFYWPEKIPSRIKGRLVDVYNLEYDSSLLSWAKKDNPNFDDVAREIFETLKLLRVREYRSIGFIAHSLGGNLVSTYIHTVKTKLGHPQRSQHAYVITLATPVLGSQVANIGSILKSLLGMSDPLLESLKSKNLYLTMLTEFRNLEMGKGERYQCRPVNMHAAYEKEYLGPLLIVSEDSAALPISEMVSSPIVGFDLDHSEIAKPSGTNHVVYKWVNSRLNEEMTRLGNWNINDSENDQIGNYELCNQMRYIPEQ